MVHTRRLETHRLLESEEKTGCTIHSDFEELCKSCIYNFLLQHLHDIELPGSFWCTAMKLDRYVVFSKIKEVSPPSYIVNVVIEPDMTMKVYSTWTGFNVSQCRSAMSVKFLKYWMKSMYLYNSARLICLVLR